MTDYINLLDKLTEGRTLPEGYTAWGIKSTHPDLTTRGGFQWPFPGNATDTYPLDDHDRSCPRREGDGVCVATSWLGMASAGYTADTLLLVAYRSVEARGYESGKLRVPQAFVVALIDGVRLVRDHGSGANLYGANLPRANLYGASLSGANLSGANLSVADLSMANLSRANLYGADLFGANLSGANLYGADLRGANLPRADLSGADLFGANLSEAYLSGAYLSGADLSGADLSGANLSGADLSGANASSTTLWPRGLDPVKAGVTV